MKPFTKFALVVMAGAAGWGMYQDKFYADENRMESVHRSADIRHQVECTKTEGLAEHAWLACRWGDNGDWGSIWVQREDDEGAIWLARNGKAMQVVERHERLPHEKKIQAIRLRLTTPEDSMSPDFANLPSVPWDRLD